MLNGLSLPALLQELWIKAEERYTDFRKHESLPIGQYEADSDWERHVHEWINVSWPCSCRDAFEQPWAEGLMDLHNRGIQAGPASFKAWNDGDTAFVRTLWSLVQHLKPERVIETGVAHGVSSRLILEGLERNGKGHLWSIDLPPWGREWQEQVGIAVPDRLKHRWTYIRGSSRRCLPDLLTVLDQIDLFIHDSLHSERNVRFEIDQAYPRLRPGGVIVVDDVDVNWAFRRFMDSSKSGRQVMVCEAEPVRPDPRRFNNKGLFGIIVKGGQRGMAAAGAG